MKIDQICLQTAQIATDVGMYIAQASKNFNRQSVETKSFNQLVSHVDRTAEIKLVEALAKVLPEAGFITEEETISFEQKEWMWVIDPLDGTTNFVHDIPVYSVSIGLMHNGTTKLGVVYEINRAELFYACDGMGALLNGTKIYVKQEPNISRTLMATGFPYYDFEAMNAYLNTLQELMKCTQGMRRMGSAAVDLAYVACGRFDGFFEYGLSPWDVCAGAYIVQQAGGIVTDFNLGNNYIDGRQIIAASASIHAQLHQVLAKHFEQP
jgi:myo-inositol-1(or 4)-monophosphatase